MTNFPSLITLGGHRIDLRPGKYPDGRDCVVASHPDLPGCVSYADSAPEALALLRVAREAIIASMRRHGESLPQEAATTTTTHWQMTLRPLAQNVFITPTSGASPALQTA